MDKVIYSRMYPNKLPKFLRKNFVFNFLDRILGLNRFNRTYHKIVQLLPKNATAQDFFNTCLNYHNIKVKRHNLEHIPQKGRCIIVANHPLGIWDGIALMSAILDIRNDIKALGLTEYMNFLEILKQHIIMLDKNDIKKKYNIIFIFHAIYSYLRKNSAVLIFPSGRVSDFILRSLSIKDPIWHKSAVEIALQTNTPLIICSIRAQNPLWWYFTKVLGSFRYNLLLHATHSYKNKTIELFFGKPLTPEFLKQFDNTQQATNYIYDLVYKIIEI